MRADFVKKSAIRAAWLLCLFLTIFPLRAQATEENGMPQPVSAKVYSSMSDSSDIVANLIVGNVFEVVGDGSDDAGGRWYRVRTDFGVEGYMKAEEFERLNTLAQAMMSPAAAQEPEAEMPGEGQQVPEGEHVGETDGSAVQAPADQTDRPGADAPDTDQSDRSGADVPAADQAEIPDADVAAVDQAEIPDGEVPKDSPVGEQMEQGSPSNSSQGTDVIDGAGFGRVEDSLQTEEAPDNEGFTVVERPDVLEMRRHGRIDAVLIMIIAGGIICIVAIAALMRKMWSCIRTGA